MGSPEPNATRRDLLKAALSVPITLSLARWSEARPSLPATPACGDDPPTPASTAGPFFKPRSPQRGSLLEPGLAGTRLVVSGRVVTVDCRPEAGAILDFWQADDDGDYDNAGFRLRGHQLTGADGRYLLETIVPAAYAGRTRHLHVKVQTTRGRVLTTQLFFPDEPRNARDGLFTPRLLMEVREATSGRTAGFDFVLPGA